MPKKHWKKLREAIPSPPKRGDCVTLFGETATWDKFTELRNIAKTIDQWRREELVNNAMLFRINHLIDLVTRAEELLREREIHRDDMECLKWRAMLRYTTSRNIGKQVKEETKKKEMQREFSRVAKWLEDHGSRLKIALWDVLYNNR